jgi:hypothetical protein
LVRFRKNTRTNLWFDPTLTPCSPRSFALFHKHVAANLGAEVLLDLENHHNFAWKERHVIKGVEKEVIVHRKGATPAGEGVLGIIPGSMASPGFVVSGKGNPESLNSASHGAGRVMSRTQATKTFEWSWLRAGPGDSGLTGPDSWKCSGPCRRSWICSHRSPEFHGQRSTTPTLRCRPCPPPHRGWLRVPGWRRHHAARRRKLPRRWRTWPGSNRAALRPKGTCAHRCHGQPFPTLPRSAAGRRPSGSRSGPHSR